MGFRVRFFLVTFRVYAFVFMVYWCIGVYVLSFSIRVAPAQRNARLPGVSAITLFIFTVYRGG